MLHISELTNLVIPDGMRLWFGGFLPPSDLSLGNILYRDGTEFYLMMDNSPYRDWVHSTNGLMGKSDIIAYTSNIKGYDLSVDEQFFVENMAVELASHQEKTLGNVLEENAKVRLEQYSRAEEIRSSAFALYMTIREHVKPNPFPEKWAGDLTVGNMISNLHTLPLDMPIHSAYHVSIGDEMKCRIRHPTVSRERVDGREIKTGDETVPYSAVLWSQCRTAEDNLKE